MEEDERRLRLAAETGDVEELRRILTSNNIQVDCRDKHGVTGLMLSAANGHVGCVRELLSHGSDPEAKKLNGATALLFASLGGHKDIAEELLKQEHCEHLVNIPTYDGATPLLAACERSQLELAQLLLSRGANIHSSTADGASALFLASQNGDAAMVDLLLSNQANINATRSDGASALYIACQLGHLAVVKRLLEAGALVNQGREDGSSPLSKAAQKGHVEVTRCLLGHSPELGILPNGDSALHSAAIFGQLSVMQELLSAGAEINLKNEDGLTPEGLAQIFGHTHVLSYLQQLNDTTKPR